MTPTRVYVLGVVLVALVGFFSPWWWLGFLPLGAGLIWAAYDLVDDGSADGDVEGTPPRRD